MLLKLVHKKKKWLVGAHQQLWLAVSYPHSMRNLYSYLGAGQGDRTALLLPTEQPGICSRNLTLQPSLIQSSDPGFKELARGTSSIIPPQWRTRNRLKWRRTEQLMKVHDSHVLCYPTLFFWPHSFETSSCGRFRCHSKHCDTWSTPCSALCRSMQCAAEWTNQCQAVTFKKWNNPEQHLQRLEHLFNDEEKSRVRSKSHWPLISVKKTKYVSEQLCFCLI